MIHKVFRYKKRLGRFNKALVIRFVKYRGVSNLVNLVLTKRRARSGSRCDKLGFLQITRSVRHKYTIFGINREKIKEALIFGAYTHASVYKILYV